MKTPLLETERLILRPVSLEDAPAIQKHFNNWNIIKNLTHAVPWPYPDDGAETFLRELALPNVDAGHAHIWTLSLKEGNGEAIGLIDYHENRTSESGGNRGFWLAETYWRNGYMSEAIISVQDWLFFTKGITKMIVVNAESNEGSRRVKEKTGAKLIGQSSLLHHNGISNTQIWEITAKSWKEFRETL